jgi:hypothetical protein
MKNDDRHRMRQRRKCGFHAKAVSPSNPWDQQDGTHAKKIHWANDKGDGTLIMDRH